MVNVSSAWPVPAAHRDTRSAAPIRPRSEVSDKKTILERIAAGDSAAVQECIRAYGDLVWSLARRFTAVLLPAFMARLRDGRHRLVVDPPFEVHPEAAIAVAAMNHRIEEPIRAYPEQWVWMHRRWRRQPPPADRMASH